MFLLACTFLGNPGWDEGMKSFSGTSAEQDCICRRARCVCLIPPLLVVVSYLLSGPFSLKPVSSSQLNELLHVGLILHRPYLSTLTLSFPSLISFEISCCLVLSRFLNLQLLSLLIQTSIQRSADTVDNTSAGLCWCTTFSQSECSLYPFIHLQSQLPLQLSPAHFFFSGFPPAVLWFHCRLRLTSSSVTLGGCFTANQTNGFWRLFRNKQWYDYLMYSRPFRNIQDCFHGIFQVIACVHICHKKKQEKCTCLKVLLCKKACLCKT